MSKTDTISQFFPGEEDVNLYAVLNILSSAKPEEIRKSYRRLALLYHPDKHVSSSENVRAEASIKFQQLGFAYSILGDNKKREKYDRTGSINEEIGLQAGEDGWEAYFADLFESVTKEKLDEMKNEYQGSNEEIEDLKRSYVETNGSIGEIMNHIPHSTNKDEDRFILLINQLINNNDLPKLKTWEISIKDENAKRNRKKESEKEATEAEELAKELGFWDEFYGSGRPSQRRGKGKGKMAAEGGAVEEDSEHASLQALILKRQKNRDGFFDSLAEKYAEIEGKKGKVGVKKGRKRKSDEVVDANASAPPEIDDAKFAKLQEELFGNMKTEVRTADTRKNLKKQKKFEK